MRICVNEISGLQTRSFIIDIKIFDKKIKTLDDVKNAVMKACTEYINTEIGKKTYEYNCECFNWADFESEVPNEICRKYGFEKESMPVADEFVDWDEQLIIE